jgi:hypothetical protein
MISGPFSSSWCRSVLTWTPREIFSGFLCLQSQISGFIPFLQWKWQVTVDYEHAPTQRELRSSGLQAFSPSLVAYLPAPNHKDDWHDRRFLILGHPKTVISSESQLFESSPFNLVQFLRRVIPLDLQIYHHMFSPTNDGYWLCLQDSGISVTTLSEIPRSAIPPESQISLQVSLPSTNK